MNSQLPFLGRYHDFLLRTPFGVQAWHWTVQTFVDYIRVSPKSGMFRARQVISPMIFNFMLILKFRKLQKQNLFSIVFMVYHVVYKI